MPTTATVMPATNQIPAGEINGKLVPLMSRVSMADLLYMRNHDGKSNKEIAKYLGVSYVTILHHIGRQPKAITMRNLRKRSAKIIPMPEVTQTDMTASATPTPEPERLFNFTEKLSIFSGTGKYTVASNDKNVQVIIAGTEINLSFADFCNVAKEISAIAQNIAE